MRRVIDHWGQGDSYERFIGRWSRRVAPRFLSWLGLPEGLRWLDVGCGTGALSAAILERSSPSSVTGVEPSEGFLATARDQLGDRARLLPGSAERIPLDDGSVDATVSGLALNFVPDPREALVEMQRVTVPSGTIAVYLWDYTGGMEMLHVFWEAAAELDPEAAKLDEGPRFPICDRDALADLFTRAGLRGVEVMGFDIPTHFETFDDYWNPFLGGQGPAPPTSRRSTKRRARGCGTASGTSCQSRRTVPSP